MNSRCSVSVSLQFEDPLALDDGRKGKSVAPVVGRKGKSVARYPPKPLGLSSIVKGSYFPQGRLSKEEKVANAKEQLKSMILKYHVTRGSSSRNDEAKQFVGWVQNEVNGPDVW